MPMEVIWAAEMRKCGMADTMVTPRMDSPLGDQEYSQLLAEGRKSLVFVRGELEMGIERLVRVAAETEKHIRETRKAVKHRDRGVTSLVRDSAR